MDILVKIKNLKEQRVLQKFLEKRRYEFQIGDERGEAKKKAEETLANEEQLEQLNAEIEKGHYADQHKVEMLLSQRRNTVFK